MPKVAPGQLVVIRIKPPKGAEEIFLSYGVADEIKHDVARVKLDAAIARHDSHNERASPRRYGKTRCMNCKRTVARYHYNECPKCHRYVCNGCRSTGGSHWLEHFPIMGTPAL